MSKLRWGILGAARVNERLLPAIVQAPNSELVAIASRRAGAAAETLAKYAPQVSSVKIYDDLDALLGDSNVQAVYIPLANHEHAQWALKAIDAGKHVLIEKPMAIKLADIEAIEAAAQAKQVKVMEGFMCQSQLLIFDAPSQNVSFGSFNRHGWRCHVGCWPLCNS